MWTDFKTQVLVSFWKTAMKEKGSRGGVKAHLWLLEPIFWPFSITILIFIPSDPKPVLPMKI